MNVICSTIEAVTGTIEVIGMGIGNLSVVWSWISGGWHCCEGILINPAISTVCGPIIGVPLAFIQDCLGSIFGSPTMQLIAGLGGK